MNRFTGCMNVFSVYLHLKVNPLTHDFKKVAHMNFRDINGQKYKQKSVSYNGNRSFRDMNSTREISEKQKNNTAIPETIQVSNTDNMTPKNNSMYSQQINFPQNQSINYQQFTQNQSINYRQANFTHNQSVNYQQSNFMNNQSINYKQKSIPSIHERPQSQFLYYTNSNNNNVNNSNINNNIPVPPPLPKPDPPQPPKPEVPTPTPPPKMVKAKKPIVRRTDSFSSDLGAFSGTFDSESDQSTPLADIPVMNNIDDYKI